MNVNMYKQTYTRTDMDRWNGELNATREKQHNTKQTQSESDTHPNKHIQHTYTCVNKHTHSNE